LGYDLAAQWDGGGLGYENQMTEELGERARIRKLHFVKEGEGFEEWG